MEKTHAVGDVTDSYDSTPLACESISSSSASLHPLPADMAVDWIANNLYRTELRRRHIVVQDLDTGETVSLIQATADETFRAIAVDPTRKYALQ